MIRMGWSWPEYCALPAGYLPVLIALLREQDAANRRRAARRKR